MYATLFLPKDHHLRRNYGGLDDSIRQVPLPAGVGDACDGCSLPVQYKPYREYSPLSLDSATLVQSFVSQYSMVVAWGYRHYSLSRGHLDSCGVMHASFRYQIVVYKRYRLAEV
jgi:hypothetical protein